MKNNNKNETVVRYVAQCLTTPADKQSIVDVTASKRKTKAEELGRLIAEKKGWSVKVHDIGIVSTLDLYVFTVEEFNSYLDSIKAGFEDAKK